MLVAKRETDRQIARDRQKERERQTDRDRQRQGGTDRRENEKSLKVPCCSVPVPVPSYVHLHCRSEKDLASSIPCCSGGHSHSCPWCCFVKERNLIRAFPNAPIPSWAETESCP